jgi:hypothetical protein
VSVSATGSPASGYVNALFEKIQLPIADVALSPEMPTSNGRHSSIIENRAATAAALQSG